CALAGRVGDPDEGRCTVCHGAETLFAFPQGLLGPLPFADIRQLHGYPSLLRPSGPERIDLEPAVYGFHVVDEALLFASHCDACAKPDPVIFYIWHERPDRLALGIHQAGVGLEGRVGHKVAEIDRRAGIVEDHLPDAEANVYGLEE